MPEVRCKCGAMTNSALSEYWNREDLFIDLADGCYAKWVDGKYEKGCLYDKTNPNDFMRKFADKNINGE